MAVLAIGPAVGSTGAQEATKNLTTDLYKAPLVYDDVVNFIRVQKLHEAKVDTVTIL